ncbi:FG-GAP repeat protein, partial [Streptomyces sp. A1136]|uniref:FG-GAP repeat protein n=1 Tax=Streptomyces sp. A1136 TaxID=2563102 RepID=UPI00113BB123
WARVPTTTNRPSPLTAAPPRSPAPVAGTVGETGTTETCTEPAETWPPASTATTVNRWVVPLVRRETVAWVAGAVAVAGGVHVFRGSAAGLVTGSGVQAVNRTSAGVPGDARRAEQFGIEVALTDANADGRADLVVGASDADGLNSGSVTYLPSRGARVAAPGARLVLPGQAGLPVTRGLAFGAHFAR